MLGTTATFLLVSLVFPAAFSYRVATSEVVDFTLYHRNEHHWNHPRNKIGDPLSHPIWVTTYCFMTRPVELLSNSLTSDHLVEVKTPWYRIAARPISTADVFISSCHPSYHKSYHDQAAIFQKWSPSYFNHRYFAGPSASDYPTYTAPKVLLKSQTKFFTSSQSKTIPPILRQR